MSVGTFQLPDFGPTGYGSTQNKTNIINCLKALERIARSFAAHEQSPPDMTVRVDPGPVFDIATWTLGEKAAQDTAVIVAPTTYPRIDRVVIGRFTAEISVVPGVEAAVPSPPAIPAGKLPICQITLQTTSTVITNNMITEDERVLNYLGIPDPPDPPPPKFNLVETKILNGDASVSFPDLDPSKQYELKIRVVPSTANSSIYLRFNGDTGGNYNWATHSVGGGTHTPGNNTVDNMVYLTDPSIFVTNYLKARVLFDCWPADNHKVEVTWEASCNSVLNVEGSARYSGSANLTSVSVHLGYGTLTGIISLYSLDT